MKNQPKDRKKLSEKLIDLDVRYGDHIKTKEFLDFYNGICANICVTYIDNKEEVVKEELKKYGFWDRYFFPYNNSISNEDLGKWLMTKENNFLKFHQTGLCRTNNLIIVKASSEKILFGCYFNRNITKLMKFGFISIPSLFTYRVLNGILITPLLCEAAKKIKEGAFMDMIKYVMEVATLLGIGELFKAMYNYQFSNYEDKIQGHIITAICYKLVGYIKANELDSIYTDKSKTKI